MAYQERDPLSQTLDRDVIDGHMEGRKQNLMNFWRQYKGVFEATNFTNNTGLKKTEKWVQQTKYVDDYSEKDSIVHREEFFRSEYAQTLLKDAVPVYREFMAQMNEASPFISAASKTRWMKRFYDETTSFQAKKYWIRHQFSTYLAAWKLVAKEREALAKDPGFKDLITLNPKFAILADAKKEAFLDMHYDKRKDLVAEAKSVIAAQKKGMLALHASTEKKLRAAVDKKVLSPTKVGSWLQRIFKGKHSAIVIKKFLEDNGAKTLEELIQNWTNVKKKYDAVTKKAKERGEDSAARGMNILTEAQFLNLHYSQRLKYVEEQEKRLNAAVNIRDENPLFIKIRHAMDIKDWEEAALLIAEAKADPKIQGTERIRLDSMAEYAMRFTKKSPSTEAVNNVLHAKTRIDNIMHDLGKSHSSLKPMIMRLMTGPNANRSINQLSWMVYNNDWCRTHGFLDDDIARKGASKENEIRTKERTKRGLDVGRHDAMSYNTSGKQHIRKKEFANHKATYRHINLNDSETLTENAEWLEHEQDPKELYWTTACFHEKGEPKSGTWHKDLLMMLKELRTHTRTIGNAEMIYRGPSERLQKRGVSTSKSYAMAA